MIDVGEFREDFFYRIAEHEIFVPPLREQMEERIKMQVQQNMLEQVNN